MLMSALQEISIFIGTYLLEPLKYHL